MKKLTHEQVEKRFLDHGFRLLGEYQNANQPIEVEGIACGHITKKRVGDLGQGKGCLVCAIEKRAASRRFSQEDAKVEFGKFGYQLKGKYKNAREPVLVKCPVCSQDVKLRLDNVKSGQGCPACSGKEQSERQRTPIEKLHDEIRNLGYEPVFESFETTRKRLLVKCRDGHPPFHVLLSQLRSMKKGCPFCTFKGENLLRGYLEFVLERTSRKIQIKDDAFEGFSWLELDIYFEDLALAFEYQGHQHYEFPNAFDKEVKEFEERQRRDRAKKEWCEKQGVLLVEVFESMSLKMVPDHIKKVLTRFEKRFPQAAELLNCFDTPIENFSLETTNLTRLKNYVLSKGGICLSNVWLGVMEKYKFQCNLCNNKWETSANKIYQGSWCPSCANRNRNRKSRRPILQKTFDGEVVKSWPSLTAAMKEYSSAIRACLQGKTKQSHGYVWTYDNSDIQ
ncbi:MAG: hypothetical protein C0623_04730 [Desulfuromonas sp.]|nr:MAG: hypothetical protein C0623_04730 [Desulfuromonas sp.]